MLVGGDIHDNAGIGLAMRAQASRGRTAASATTAHPNRRRQLCSSSPRHARYFRQRVPSVNPQSLPFIDADIRAQLKSGTCFRTSRRLPSRARPRARRTMNDTMFRQIGPKIIERPIGHGAWRPCSWPVPCPASKWPESGARGHRRDARNPGRRTARRRAAAAVLGRQRVRAEALRLRFHGDYFYIAWSSSPVRTCRRWSSRPAAWSGREDRDPAGQFLEDADR